jgi:hypothetical protein
MAEFTCSWVLVNVIAVVHGLVKGMDVTEVAAATATLAENTIRHRVSHTGIDFFRFNLHPQKRNR